MIKVALPAAIAGVILAQAAEAPPSLGSLENLTAQGVLGFVVGWLITRTLPSWQKQFTELNKSFASSVDKAFAAMEAMQTRHLETQKQLDDRRHEDSEELRKVLVALRENCAVVNRQS